jgi:hypothetical protein
VITLAPPHPVRSNELHTPNNNEQGTDMTSRTSAIEHPVRRLLIALPEPYDAAREHYETLS